jgi:hypothetical protein
MLFRGQDTSSLVATFLFLDYFYLLSQVVIPPQKDFECARFSYFLREGCRMTSNRRFVNPSSDHLHEKKQPF